MNLSNSDLYATWRKRLKQIMPDITHVKYRLKNMMLADGYTNQPIWSADGMSVEAMLPFQAYHAPDPDLTPP
jgi:hypothetical protein